MLKQQLQQGYTLAELMIVVAIISIIASYAMPAYNQYISKAQSIEGVKLLGGLLTPLSDHVQSEGVWPLHLDELGSIDQGTYVSTLRIFSGGGTNGTLTVRATMKEYNINSSISGMEIDMIITINNNTSWECQPKEALDNQYLPTACHQ